MHFLRTWWECLLSAERAGKLVVAGDARAGFTRFLVVAVAVLYAVYGTSMGLFRGGVPALVSGLKLPFLYLMTLTLVFPAFYALNCLTGPRFRVRQCLRLLLLAISANAAALASYAPISFFFTLTTSREGYRFLALMHVAAFAVSGIISIAVILVVFRAAAKLLGRGIYRSVGLTWAVLYGFVGSELAWVLRPWIGWWHVEYAPFRPLERSFIEAMWFMLTR